MKILTRRLKLTVAMLALLCASGCSLASGSPGAPTSSSGQGSRREAPVSYGSSVHVMPTVAAGASTNTATNTASGAHLDYYGGHTISNVKVVAVYWGSGVSSTIQSQMPLFYSAFVQSPMFDWLNEYDTDVTAVDGNAGTNQVIGRGTFDQAITITPSVTASTIDDSQIQAELNTQINNGVLPSPDANTIYMINFPKGITITQHGQTSCVQFCAYHGTFTRSGQSVFYAVLPSLESGTACNGVCGSAAATIDNQTSVASHEMIEAVTDAEVGLVTSVMPPMAWYDSTSGEIGDICNAQQATFTDGSSHVWTVQKEWSNQQNACVTTRSTSPSDDFWLSLSASSLTVAPGSSIHVPVSTAVTSGNAESISLSVSGLPSGVTGSFSPSDVTAGQTSTLTLTAQSSATTLTQSFIVTGTGSTGTHSQGGTVTVGNGGGSSKLENGIPLSNLSAQSGNQLGFALDVPSGATNLKFSISGGTGDADLYVKYGSAPTLSSYDCWPNIRANNETCNLPTATQGTWYVMLNAYQAFSGVTLTGSYDASVGGSGDFSVGVSSNAINLTPGSSQTITVNSAVVSGTAASITLHASSLPTGVTATLNPATITAGESASVTYTADASAPAVSGDYTRLYGVSTDYSHYRVAHVTVGGKTGITGDYSMTLSNNAFVLGPGESRTITVDTALTSGNAEDVGFHVTSLPTGVTATFAQTTITAGESTTLTLAADASAPPVSSDSIRVYGESSDHIHYRKATVSVQTGADFNLGLSTNTISLQPGGSQSITMTTSGTSGTSPTILFSATSLPAGVTVTFNPTQVNAGQSTTITFTADASAAPISADYVRLYGKSGADTHYKVGHVTVN